MKKQYRKGRKRKVVEPIKRNELEKEIEKFLNNGGRITRVEQLDYEGFVELGNIGAEGDDFLMGV